MSKLPSKFEFTTKMARADKWIAEMRDGYYYVKRKPDSLDDAYDVLVKYSVGFITEAVQYGAWIVEKDLSEPELVFPFTIQHFETHSVYVVTKGSEEGRVTCTKEPTGEVYANVYSVEAAASHIQQGHWIVKHVGEKPVEKAPEKDVAMLTVGVDSSQVVAATEHVEKLRQAYVDLAIAMESVIALQRELKGI